MAREPSDDRENAAREFRDEDREKTVVAPQGFPIGRIDGIEPDGNRATVTRTEDHDSLTDEIKDLLGWDDEEETEAKREEYELHRDHVDQYKDDAIHLRE